MRFCRTVFISLLMIGGSVAAFPETVQTNVQLPGLVSDGMVLQRHTEINIWG
ncbi:hypothetical protein SAMN05443144_101166 [Fodinibius roseus]|uniref:Uncharacterized protein n=1 Tax=Fodinibius roseus TaxID=1194090 RepID=A0A1M4SZN2_9BACT|nr:hypothetical protein [Fodinibius roseus]SHE37633.1 hypothetical protein SAMN05443144_101166 [Fodinibius roseus]